MGRLRQITAAMLAATMLTGSVSVAAANTLQQRNALREVEFCHAEGGEWRGGQCVFPRERTPERQSCSGAGGALLAAAILGGLLCWATDCLSDDEAER